MTKTNSTPAPRRSCDHCGGRVTSRGRASRTGRYYCSTKPECIAAKQRAWYREMRDGSTEREMAPSTCACCGTPLKPRRARHGDSPIGRWCRLARCQRDRELRTTAATSTTEELLTLRFLATAENPEKVATCPTCGTERGVAGFVHPARDASGAVYPCKAMGDVGVQRSLVEMRWPEFF